MLVDMLLDTRREKSTNLVLTLRAEIYHLLVSSPISLGIKQVEVVIQYIRTLETFETPSGCNINDQMNGLLVSCKRKSDSDASKIWRFEDRMDECD